MDTPYMSYFLQAGYKRLGLVITFSFIISTVSAHAAALPGAWLPTPDSNFIRSAFSNYIPAAAAAGNFVQPTNSSTSSAAAQPETGVVSENTAAGDTAELTTKLDPAETIADSNSGLEDQTDDTAFDLIGAVGDSTTAVKEGAAENPAVPEDNRHNGKSRHVVPGDFIVVLKQGARGEEVLKTHGLNARHQYSHALNGFAANVPEGRLQVLKNDPRVALVEPDIEMSALGQTVPTGVRRIGANRCAIAKIDGSDDRVNADVAILDTGIDLTHSDLNVYQHVSFSSDSVDGNDGNGHGTHVAGTVGALDNGIGVVGVAPGVRLWGVKVLDNGGSGALSTIIKGVDYVTQHASEIEVANMSLGGQGSSDSLRIAIQNSVAAGVLYVVAAGNSSFEIYGGDAVLGTSDDFFPASYPEVMTVSALADTDGQAGGTGLSTAYGADDTLASFSNWSSRVVANNPVTSPGAAIDVAAPGVGIYSTYKGGGYATMSGTSMASPHVAGVAALYIAANGRAYGAAGVAAIRQALINGAEPQNSWGVNPTNPFPNDRNPEGLVRADWIGTASSGPPNTLPTIAITSPASNASLDSTATVILSGTASDAEDGTLSGRIVWASSIDGQLGSGASISIRLSVGTHTVTARVTDSAGGSAVAGVTVIITSSSNNPPTISLTNPASGSVFNVGVPVSFSAVASDLEDGAISSKIVWSYNGGTLGNGPTVSVAFGTGSFTVVATVQDSGGKTAMASVSIAVGTASNTAPTISISSPVDGATFGAGTAVPLTGSAADSQDGNLSSKINWSSSVDGSLGSGSSLSAGLSVGTHTITAKVTDAGGLTSSTSVTVTVTSPNTAPTLAITSPGSGLSAIGGTAIRFTGNATDTQDGNLSAKIVWASSLSGQIGTGASFSTILNAGAHLITARVTDSAGATATSSVTVTVNNPNTPPTVSISSPSNGYTALSSSTIQFTGSATDTQDGNLSAKIVWTSNLAGQIGVGAGFSRALSAGTHLISAKVTDAAGVTTISSVTVTVSNPDSLPSISITAPANGTSALSTSPLQFIGNAADAEDGDLSFNIVWTSSLSGQIGTGATFSSALSAGSHVITATIIDHAGNSATTSVTVTVTDPNATPNVSILSPANGTIIVQSAGITLSGKASDPEDGDLSRRIVWSSSIDGTLGTGANLNIGLSAGNHTITAAVTDSSGATARSSVSISIPTPTLLVSVSTPATSYVNKDTVNLTVTAAGKSGAVAGASVSLVITTAGGRTVSFQTITDGTGRAVVQYNINAKRDATGTYSVQATASMSGYNSGSSSTSFLVTK